MNIKKIKKWSIFSGSNSFDSYGKSHKILPDVVIIIPVLREQQNLPSLAGCLAQTSFPTDKLQLLFVTTEREFEMPSASPSSLAVIDEYIGMGAFRFKAERIHYIGEGNKAEQLQFALSYLHNSQRLNRETIVGALDADCLFHTYAVAETIGVFIARPEVEVVQIPVLWLKNFLEQVRGAGGIMLRAFCLLQSFYSISYELEMLNSKEYDFPYKMKYLLGCGLFIRATTLSALGGYPGVVEDTRLGHICSMTGVKIATAPTFAAVDSAVTFTNLVKQTSVWYTGEMMVLADFFIAKKTGRLIKDKFYLLRLLFYKMSKNCMWLCEGPLVMAAVATSLTLSFNMAMQTLMMLLIITVIALKVVVPVTLIRRELHWLAKPFLINKPFAVSLTVTLAGIVIFMTKFLGPVFSLGRIAKQAVFGAVIRLPKTERMAAEVRSCIR